MTLKHKEESNRFYLFSSILISASREFYLLRKLSALEPDQGQKCGIPVLYYTFVHYFQDLDGFFNRLSTSDRRSILMAAEVKGAVGGVLKNQKINNNSNRCSRALNSEQT